MMRRLVPLAVALLVAGCGEADEAPAPKARADPTETKRVGDAAVSFYTSHDPAICRSTAALTLIKKTGTTGAAALRKAIRSCERNRKAGRVPAPGDVDVLRVQLDGRTATAYVAIRSAGEPACAILGLEKLSGPWRVASIDGFDCSRVP